MNPVLDQILSGPASARGRFGGTLVLALVSHLGAGIAAASIPRHEAPPQLRETEIQALPEEPPLPPPTTPPPATEAPDPEKAATPSPLPNAPAAAAPPPAAAANVMTATDDAPADFSDGMVVGSAETFVGGAVVAKSTEMRVGSSQDARVSGAKTVSSAPAALKGPDLSRPPRLAEGFSWNCPFPAEADEKGIDDAVVGLSIEVAANGTVMNVTVERDPGTGFARVASACARMKRFSSAVDRDGISIGGRLRVNVRFHR